MWVLYCHFFMKNVLDCVTLFICFIHKSELNIRTANFAFQKINVKLYMTVFTVSYREHLSSHVTEPIDI